MYAIVYPNDPQYKGIDAFYRESIITPIYYSDVIKAPVKLVINSADATLFRTKRNAKIRLAILKIRKLPKGYSKPYIASAKVQVIINLAKTVK